MCVIDLVLLLFLCFFLFLLLFLLSPFVHPIISLCIRLCVGLPYFFNYISFFGRGRSCILNYNFVFAVALPPDSVPDISPHSLRESASELKPSAPTARCCSVRWSRSFFSLSLRHMELLASLSSGPHESCLPHTLSSLHAAIGLTSN